MIRPFQSFARFCRRFGRDRRGSTAIEFAFVALPFFVMLFAVLELALIFTLDAVLESATIDTGRLVRTGQASAASFGKDKFKQELCSRMSIFSADCADRAIVDVRPITTFNSPIVADPVTDGALDDEKAAYDGGAPGSLMLVRVWYRQPVFTPFLSQEVEGWADGHTLTATTAFQNEPWNNVPTSPAP